MKKILLSLILLSVQAVQCNDEKKSIDSLPKGLYDSFYDASRDSLEFQKKELEFQKKKLELLKEHLYVFDQVSHLACATMAVAGGAFEYTLYNTNKVLNECSRILKPNVTAQRSIRATIMRSMPAARITLLTSLFGGNVYSMYKNYKEHQAYNKSKK